LLRTNLSYYLLCLTLSSILSTNRNQSFPSAATTQNAEWKRPNTFAGCCSSFFLFWVFFITVAKFVNPFQQLFVLFKSLFWRWMATIVGQMFLEKVVVVVDSQNKLFSRKVFLFSIFSIGLMFVKFFLL